MRDNFDLLVIGGGINGAGIARDAAGRGIATALVEANDFGGATSSASSKLLHGGLRYLEFGEFALVRKALAERMVIMEAAPHLTRPLPFVIPAQPDGRSALTLRTGLLLYDHLGPRGGLPATERIALPTDRAGRGLSSELRRGWRYQDGAIDDSRMVIATLRDAEARGATLVSRDAVRTGRREGDGWLVELASGRTMRTQRIINAAGPWASVVGHGVLALDDTPALRLVRGAHIVVERPTSAEDAIVVQQPDGRIVFLIPWLDRHLMIGTTEVDVESPDDAVPSLEEEDYLLAAANRVLARPLTREAIVGAFAGIRPLVVAPGRSARETSRDWQLHIHADPSVLTVIGGKITTYRRLAEAVLAVVAPGSRPWTAGATLSGGGFAGESGQSNRAMFARALDRVPSLWPDHDPALVRALLHRYGTEAVGLLKAGLGPRVGPFYEAELIHFATREYALTADDILWRRTREGVTATETEVSAVARWMVDFTST